MSVPRISSVEMVKDGLIISYDDATCAFYHESIFMAHLLKTKSVSKAAKKAVPGGVAGVGTVELRKSSS